MKILIIETYVEGGGSINRDHAIKPWLPSLENAFPTSDAITIQTLVILTIIAFNIVYR